MIISTRTRYGLRAMAELAESYPEKSMTVKEIARCQNLSAKYLEQILTPLKASGLIRSTRGMHGGYVLAKAPEETRVLEVFQILEGSPLLLECVESPEVCPNEPVCPTRETWIEVKNAIEGILAKTTLQTLVERKKKKISKADHAFQI